MIAFLARTFFLVPLLVSVPSTLAALLGVRQARLPATAGAAIAIISTCLAFVMAGQTTVFGLVFTVAVLWTLTWLYWSSRDRVVYLLPALLLLQLGVLYQERLGDSRIFGADPIFALATVVALLCFALMARFPLRASWVEAIPPIWLIAVGLLLLAIGTVGGVLGGTQRSGIPLPGVGEVVIAEAARIPLIIGVALEIARRKRQLRLVSPRWLSPRMWLDRFVSLMREEIANEQAPAEGLAEQRQVGLLASLLTKTRIGFSVGGVIAIAVLLGAAITVQTGDTGGALLLTLTTAVVCATLIGRRWPLTYTGAALLVLSFVGYAVVGEVRSRFDLWLDPGFQQREAFRAFAAGSLWGEGFGYGAPRKVPLPGSDYVVAGYANEIGILGIAALVGLLIALLIALHQCSERAFLPSTRLTAFYTALISLLGVQAFVNLLGVTGTGPVTGVPFPFLSRAGVYLLALSPVVAYALTLPHRPATAARQTEPPPHIDDRPTPIQGGR